MATVDDFSTRFDNGGRFLAQDGDVSVTIKTRQGLTYPGTLHFEGGLLRLVQMLGATDLRFPDDAPLDGWRFQLEFDDGRLRDFAVNDGRLVPLSKPNASRRQKFLENFRAASGFFGHQKVEADSKTINTGYLERVLERAAIWLTPKSVADFNADDFPELGSSKQNELNNAVRDFLAVAREVPSNGPATNEQIDSGGGAFARIVTILQHYLRRTTENIEGVIASVEFPPSVLGWSWDVGADSEGAPIVDLTLVIGENEPPRGELGRFKNEMTNRLRAALESAGIDRWPQIRLKSVAEFKAS